MLLNLGTGSPEVYWESLPAYPYKTRSPKEHCDVVGLAPLVGFCWFVGCELENFSFFFQERTSNSKARNVLLRVSVLEDRLHLKYLRDFQYF